MKFNYGGSDYTLPSVFFPLTKDVLNKYAKGLTFTNPTDEFQEKLLDKMEYDWSVGIGPACSLTATLISPKFCVAYFKANSKNAQKAGSRNFLTSPNYLVSSSKTQDTIIKIAEQYKFLKDADMKIPVLIQEEKDPKNKAKTLTFLLQMQTDANNLMALITTILPDGEGVALTSDPSVTDAKAGVNAILKRIKPMIAERQA